MGRAGRKLKPGKRYPGGKRKVITPFDHGTEHAKAMQALYGQDGCDAIGRAFRSGLLGEATDAKAMLDTARRIANAYWAAYETGRFVCPLSHDTSAAASNEPQIDPDRIKRREVWLNECLAVVSAMGVRSEFDQLVINVNPDHGPPWLDRLCYAARQRQPALAADARILRAALDALEVLSG